MFSEFDSSPSRAVAQLQNETNLGTIAVDCTTSTLLDVDGSVTQAGNFFKKFAR
jgi:hypothetical protein